MASPTINLEFLRTTPTTQKLALLCLVLSTIVGSFYFYIAQPKLDVLTSLQGEVSKLEAEVRTNTIKAKHLGHLIAANQQLEVELAKKKERFPPADEAVTLLKQLSDLAIRLGLDIRLWKPGNQVEDPSKLFFRLPVSIEIASGYHMAALFFDRIRSLPRIMNVSGLRMGAARSEEDGVVIQTMFELTAFVAPPENQTPAQAGKSPT